MWTFSWFTVIFAIRVLLLTITSHRKLNRFAMEILDKAFLIGSGSLDGRNAVSANKWMSRYYFLGSCLNGCSECICVSKASPEHPQIMLSNVQQCSTMLRFIRWKNAVSVNKWILPYCFQGPHFNRWVHLHFWPF